MARAQKPILVWFRQDLRLADNPALAAAAKDGPVVPVFILDDEAPGKWKTGAAARWWLHHSLDALSADLAKRGSKLILRHGKADRVIADLIGETDAQAVYWNRLYEPYAVARDTVIKSSLDERRLKVRSFNASLLVEPWTVKTGADGPYRVFTPFWRAAASLIEDTAPLPAPRTLDTPAKWPRSEELTAWRLQPSKPNWAMGFDPIWSPGEAGARATDRFHRPIARWLRRRPQSPRQTLDVKTVPASPLGRHQPTPSLARNANRESMQRKRRTPRRKIPERTRLARIFAPFALPLPQAARAQLPTDVRCLPVG
jgi:deoxyribodipyrimidine photo-lyase